MSKNIFWTLNKVHRYPVTFVVKTNEDVDKVQAEIETKARKEYSIEAVIEKYMACIEEIINIPVLLEYLTEATQQSNVGDIFDEILLQSDVEFNFVDKG